MGDTNEGKTRKKQREPVGCVALGAALEEIRVERGQTVAEFLDGTGFAPSSYYRWRDGDSMPTAGGLRRLFADQPLAPEEWDRLAGSLLGEDARQMIGDRPVRAVVPVADDAALVELGRLFSLARVRRGASVDDMADAAGISRSTWRKWGGFALPDPRLSRAWARAVKLSPMERAEFGQALAAVYFGPAVVSVEGEDLGGDCDGGGDL